VSGRPQSAERHSRRDAKSGEKLRLDGPRFRASFPTREAQMLEFLSMQRRS
jgi:hypothetical protein